MKSILKDYLNEKEVPSEIKERLMTSAKNYLLLKNFGDLFITNNSKVSTGIASTIFSEKKSKK